MRGHPGGHPPEQPAAGGRRIPGLARVLAIAAAALATTATAGAAAAPASSPPPVFGVQAGNFGQTTLRGGHYAYALKPGDTVADSVVVTNYSDNPISVQAYPADLLTATGGGLSPAQAGVTMRDVGAWVKMSHPTVDLPPHGRFEDGFTLTVPSTLLPGQYLGAIVVSYSGHKPASAGESIVTRAALIIELTIPGTVHLDARISPVQTVRTNGDIEFTFDISNGGNVLFTVVPTVAIRNGDGRLTASVPVVPSGIYVIPGGRTTVKGSWSNLPSYGTVTARPEATVTLSNRTTSAIHGGSVSLCFFPWRLWIPAALVLLLLATVAYITRGRWRARLERRRVAKQFVAGLMERRGIKP